MFWFPADKFRKNGAKNGKKIGSYESTKNSREAALATISSLVEKYCPFYQKTK